MAEPTRKESRQPFPWTRLSRLCSSRRATQQVTNEDVSHDELGGANVHTAKSGPFCGAAARAIAEARPALRLLLVCLGVGVAHCAFDNDVDALAAVREMMNYLPASNEGTAPTLLSSDPAGVPGLRFRCCALLAGRHGLDDRVQIGWRFR